MQRLSVLPLGATLLVHVAAQSAFGTVPASAEDKGFFGNPLDHGKKDLRFEEPDISKQKTVLSEANKSQGFEKAGASSFAAMKQTGRAQEPTDGDGGDKDDALPLRNAIESPKEADTRLPLQCTYEANQILDCFCCLAAQQGAIGRGDLFYGGHLKFTSDVEVQNRGHDGKFWTAKTYVWQVGGRTPGIVCEEGRLRCVCEDEENDWAVYESQCTDGEMCSPRYGDLKSDLMNAENTDIGLFPWSPKSDMTMLADEVHEACVVRGLFAAKKKSRLRSCTSQPAHDGSMETRVAMGSGSCVNAALENCGRFYSRIGCEWRLCEQRELVRQCDAVPRYSKTVFQDDVLRVDQWYRLQRYSPNDAEEMYDVFDLDGNEDIDIDEWQEACRTLGLSPDNHCKELFRQLDRTGNGKLDKHEVVLLFRNSRALWDLTRKETDILMKQRNLKAKVLHKGHNTYNSKRKKHRPESESESLVERIAEVVHQLEPEMNKKRYAQVDDRSNSTRVQNSPRRNSKPRALPTARPPPPKKRDKK
jgi:hypothetical protein